jgi:hypothetical protein
MESSGDDPIISGGRSSRYEGSEQHGQGDDHGSNHDDDQDNDHYGQVVTYHDESDHSYGSSDHHYDSHDDSDRLTLIAPSNDFF